MKRLIAILLTVVLLVGTCGALGEEAAGKYDRLRVGTTTLFNGNFFSSAIGNNVSDQDVRKLIHSYSLVSWVSGEGLFRPNRQVITSDLSISQDGATFTFTIAKDLKYNDGTPITARDYAFSFILATSRALEEAAGYRMDGSYIDGWDEYETGRSTVISGFRLIGDYHISITLDRQFLPYFFEFHALDLQPYPISVIAPGCEVKDDGNGIYLAGNMTGSVLRKTLMDPETGYASHPSVTSGPYQLAEYDGTTVTLTLNPEYKGDEEGNKPYIPVIEFRYVNSNELINELGEGELDLVVRCARNDQIQGGIALVSTGDFSRYAYSRNGLAFISFCAEDGPTADVKVRQGLASCMDKETLREKYLGSFGIVVTGYYGIGQWMYQAALGTIDIRPEAEREDTEFDARNEFSLNGLNTWSLSVERAGDLFAEAGWDLNENGEPYDPAAGGVRYRRNGDALEPLKLKLIYAENNNAGPLLQDTFVANVEKAGGIVETEAVPMNELLNRYYHLTERDCDMIMLGTNFSEVFEPTRDFSGNTNRLNGITDPEFAALAKDMRQTEPGDAVGFVKKWVKFLEYRTQIAAEIPLYSNAYLDFSVVELQGYAPGSYSSWAEAIQYSVLSDYVEDEVGEDEFIFD